MVICPEQGVDLHMAQLMPLPLIVSCFSKIQIGFSFLVPDHPGSHGQRVVERVCVCVFCYGWMNVCFCFVSFSFAFGALMLLVWHHKEHPACKN